TKSTIVRYLALLMLLLSFWGMDAQAQNGESIRITGQVTGSTGSPLAGVSISVIGGTASTSTAADGSYQITAPPNGTLRFSSIGFVSQDVAVNDRTSIPVLLMKDVTSLDEVVIVGAAFKKSDLTGAVSSVSSKVLEEKPVTSVNQALQGRVAGVFVSSPTRPTDDASIKIRGINTINGSTDPIYVIDGMVMDNTFSGFNAVNLNDVASIE